MNGSRSGGWSIINNESRPHRAFQNRMPDEFAKAVAENRLRELQFTAETLRSDGLELGGRPRCA